MVLLRESSKKSGEAADLGIVTGRSDGDGGVPHGAFLLALAEAVARWQWDAVADLRREGIERLGAQETSDAILVAAGFNGITRVADATGIHLDAHTAAHPPISAPKSASTPSRRRASGARWPPIVPLSST